MRNAILALRHRVEGEPSKLLLVNERVRLTTGEFWERAAAVAARLRDSGVRTGDRVAVLSARHDESFLSVFGSWIVGATPVLVNTSQPEATQRECLSVVEPRLVVQGEGALDDARAVAFDTLGGDGAAFDENFGGREILVFTSGSTGAPKAVRLPLEQVSENSALTAERLGLGPDDVVLVNTPPYYISGLVHFLTTLAAGGTLVSVKGFLFGSGMIDWMREHRVTCFGGAPTHLARLAETTDGATVPALRMFVSSGDHLPASVAARVRERFPRADLWVLYGITEVSGRLCFLSPEDAVRKPGSVGKPLGQMSIRVLREDGDEASPGELGEVFVRGPLLMKEYFRREEATAAALTPNGYRTGDFGYLDNDGFLFLRGRRDGVFKSGAEKISTLLVQESIATIEGVVDSAVLVVDDPFLGKVPMAFLVLADPTESGLDRVRASWREKLPATHWPKRWRVVAAIPRTGSGKAERAVLHALLDAPAS